jgi:hypothetical protein
MSVEEELRAVTDRYLVEFEQPESLTFIAEVRKAGILTDEEWKHVLRLLDSAMRIRRDEAPAETGAAISMDADPRNADWIRIVRAQRIARHYMPSWAAYWLWLIGGYREEARFWERVREVAQKMGFKKF